MVAPLAPQAQRNVSRVFLACSNWAPPASLNVPAATLMMNFPANVLAVTLNAGFARVMTQNQRSAKNAILASIFSTAPA